jgi:DNA polymerase
MQIVTLDFETFYDKSFSLSKLTTEEYIRDPQFQVIGYAVKIDEGSTKWYTGSHEELKEELDKIDWDNSMLLCHNTLFDGAILSWIFDLQPFAYLDTLCMARAIHGVNAGGSLKALAERYKIGQKGTEVLDALGKRLEDFQTHELHQYGEYCKNDVDLTYKLFQELSKPFPVEELKLIDITLRMYTQPTLKIDDGLLVTRLDEVVEEKQKLLAGLKIKLNCETEEEVRKKLASNKQFAELLEYLDVEVPMKVSPTTGKDTYALAKNDEGFIALTEHEDPFIQELCSVRLGTKSTIEESRIERFLDIGARNRSLIPIPLKYYGAHTGRWSGSDKVNFQNLPSRDAKKKALKNAILPPDGHVIMNVDSSQIEARILAWLADQEDVVDQFRKGEDVYSVFASKVFNKEVSKKTPKERFIGKTCVLGLGYGTGWSKLQHTLKTSPPGANLDDDECQRLVKKYREINNKVIELWKDCDDALDHISGSGERNDYYLDKYKCVLVTRKGLKLPNGLYIQYPNLRWDTSESQGKWVYSKRYGEVSIWGGSVVENIVQALARIVIGEQMIKVATKYKPVLTVHDAIVCTAPEEEKDKALKFIMDTMSVPPEWAKTLPVDCEGAYADNYGDC